MFEIRTKLPMEALTALVFASGVAVTFLFLPIEQAETALVGDIAAARSGETVTAVIVSLVLFLTVRRIYPTLILVNISEDLAASEGISVKRYNLLYLFLIAVIVALGVKMVGGLLTAALVAIPPSVARNFSRNLRQYAFGAMAVGMTSASLGIVLFKLTGYPAGPLIILVGTVIFLASLIFKR
jgi:ABC-type Mn2+/Zn2+ transport system permease subunit